MNNIQTPPRQREAYPTVAQVRKGKPKIKVADPKTGRTYEQLAPKADLNSKFRVHFLPGTDRIKALFGESNPGTLVKYPENSTIADGFEVTEIHAVIPARNALTAWRKGYVANNNGREIARTDPTGTYYLKLRDPLTGKWIVRDAKPYKEFNREEKITYEKNGKTIELEFKPSGVLRLVPAVLAAGYGQLVEFELKTTGFYDCLLIEDQLAGLQSLAESASGGNAAGIPIRIFRMEQEITWNKADGSASRIKKWMINIQAEPAWVKSTFSRLGAMALAGGEAAYLPAPTNLTGNMDPHADDEIVEEDGDDLEGELTEQGPAASGETTPIIIQTTTPAAMEGMLDKAKKFTVLVKGVKTPLSKLGPRQLEYVINNDTDPDIVEAAKIVKESL